MSGVDWSRLRSLTAREITAGLIRDGFVVTRQSGGHRHYRHRDGRRVTVTFHRPGQTFRPKTLRSMIVTQACWTAADLVRLRLMK